MGYQPAFSEASECGADLNGAGLFAWWGDTTCPDGTNSDDNGGTCEYNLI